ncbi:MAG: hypothetical protein JWO47_749 [Candidatus Saccharibacteria bacterium]|nr:hypothetical protein [Candidatus Saccharibacteria bacterium]
MKFIKVEGPAVVEGALVEELDNALAARDKVLFLLTGGSNIKVGVEIVAALKSQDLSNLTLILTDERFGSVGHKDSNFLQLHQTGLDERGAVFKDLLTGASFEETVANGAKAMEEVFTAAQTVIALIGMGPDGHIAGILPHSPAAVSDEVWMIGYDGGEFQRFTLTPFALSHIHKAYLNTFGEERKPQLIRLHDQMLPIAEQPAQILRHIPEVSIFNDQLGD